MRAEMSKENRIKLLRISGELFLQRFAPFQKCAILRCIKDPIPPDAEIENVKFLPDTGEIEVTLRSSYFPKADRYDKTPLLEPFYESNICTCEARGV